MSEAIKASNARQEVEMAYEKMVEAYDKWQHLGRDPMFRDNYRVYYESKLNNYRDLCTVIVERLMTYNPKVLEDLKLW